MNGTLQNFSTFGVEITGLQIGAAGDHDISNLKQLLADNGVVIIRNQSIHH